MAPSGEQEAPSLAELKAALDYEADDEALDELAWRVFRNADKADDAALSEEELDQVLTSYGVFLNPVALQTYFEFISHGEKELSFEQFTDEFPLFVRLFDRHGSYASLLQKIMPESTRSHMRETYDNAPDGDDDATRRILFDSKLAPSGAGSSSSDNQALPSSQTLNVVTSSLSKVSTSPASPSSLRSSPLSSPTASKSSSPTVKKAGYRRMSSTGVDRSSSGYSPLSSPAAKSTSPTGRSGMRRMSFADVDHSPAESRPGSAASRLSPSPSMNKSASNSPYTIRQNPRDPARKFHIRGCRQADPEVVSVEELRAWRAVYKKLDTDGDGLIKMNEFVSHIMKRFPGFKMMAPFSGDVDFESLVRKLYPGVALTDGQCEEMVAASTLRIRRTPVKISDDMQKNVKAAFEIMDTSGDGFIEPRELVEGLLNLGMDRKDVDLAYLELFIDEENAKGVDLERYTQWYIQDFAELKKTKKK